MPGRMLGGRYTVQDKVGTGGMAIVYRGMDNVLGRTVAIKTMLPQYANDPSFAARFKQEAQAAAALQSPYIVSVYDWGKDGDTYYIIMEYLRGTDLKSGIRKHGALDCRKVAQIGSQIAQALSVAHRHDIIHRDIKPQNIMVQPDGNIKVMDFGIARAKNSHLTTDNNVLGTAHYVSPEQTQGKELGPTSDIYSLGIVMYEASTGRVPFEGDDAISVALKQVNEQPVPPSQINPRVDAQLESIILKCMQKDPAARFQTAADLSRVLRDYLAGRMAAVNEATALLGGTATKPLHAAAAHVDTTQSMARTPSSPLISSSQLGTTGNVTSATEQARARASKHRRRVIIGVVVAMLAIAGVAFALWQTLGQGEKTQTVPNVLNLTQDNAEAQIEATNWFEVGTVKEQYDSTVDEGKVIDQDPDSGKEAAEGTRINLVISKGPEPAATVSVPNLTGLSPQAAESALTAVGLVGQAGESTYSDTVENGSVCAQSPASGSTAKVGDVITYQISLGTKSVDVPEVTGQSLADAKSALTSVGFTVGDVSEQYSDKYASGTVISASPTGSQPKGTTISLVVSKGPEPDTSSTNTGSDSDSNSNSSNSSSNSSKNTNSSSETSNSGSGDKSNSTDTSDSNKSNDSSGNKTNSSN